MTTHRSNRSRYTPVTSSSECSENPLQSPNEATSNCAQRSSSSSDSSDNTAGRIEPENQDEENSKFEKIRRPLPHKIPNAPVGSENRAPRDSESESEYVFAPEIEPKDKVDHDAAVVTNHEPETASQAVAHSNTPAPLNPPAEEDTARLHAKLRADIEHYRYSHSLLSFHMTLTIALFFPVFLLPNVIWCGRPAMQHLLNSIFLVFYGRRIL